MHLVYLIENQVNGKIYIGKTCRTLHRRWMVHNCEANKGLDRYFHRAIRKYGKDAFCVRELSRVDTDREASKLERFWITEFFHSNNPIIGYNSTNGGEGMSGYKQSKETIEKIRQGNLGLKRSLKTLEKMSVSRKGVPLGPPSEEHRKKISKALTGIKRSEETKKKISLAGKGRKVSEEARKNMSLVRLGKPRPEAVREALRKGWEDRFIRTVAWG